MKDIVLFYGFEKVCKKRLQTRGEHFVCKYVTIGKEKMYEPIDDGMYINNQGNSTDRMKLARTINIMFGSRLVIEME